MTGNGGITLFAFSTSSAPSDERRADSVGLQTSFEESSRISNLALLALAARIGLRRRAVGMIPRYTHDSVLDFAYVASRSDTLGMVVWHRVLAGHALFLSSCVVM